MLHYQNTDKLDPPSGVYVHVDCGGSRRFGVQIYSHSWQARWRQGDNFGKDFGGRPKSDCCFSRQTFFCLPFSHTLRTFCVQDFPQLHHLSTGDLLRQHVREKTTLGIEAKSFMDDGKLVPDSLMIDLVMKDATPILEEGRSLLLDGFPRTIEQAKALDDVVNVDMVINLDIPTETIVARIADRYVV